MKKIIFILSMVLLLMANTTVNQQIVFKGLNVPEEYKSIVLYESTAYGIAVKNETVEGLGLAPVPIVVAIIVPIATHVFIKIIDHLWDKWVDRGKKDNIVIIIMDKKKFSINEKEAMIEYYKKSNK
ncbi:MAG: hypothetical protein NTY36_15715 [Deltaproteobacteria bacterium]|nr:hypothetical protein [Deltaproteobacteria bacterium]